jgi:ATP-dependent DNA ligase
MTPLLPGLADALPADVQLDGELVALDVDGRPDFHRLGSRMLRAESGYDAAGGAAALGRGTTARGSPAGA